MFYSIMYTSKHYAEHTLGPVGPVRPNAPAKPGSPYKISLEHKYSIITLYIQQKIMLNN